MLARRVSAVAVLSVLSCLTRAAEPAAQATAKKGNSMIDESVVAAIRAHDRRILKNPPPVTPALAPALQRELPKLDTDAKMIASMFLAQSNGPGAGGVLLSLSADRSVQVASSAAKALVSVKDTPPGDSIVEAIPTRTDATVRGYLYFAAGNARNPPGLSTIRGAAKLEKDPKAAERAEAAIVKLGGDVERKAFIKRVRNAGPDDVMNIRDQMLYIADRKLAKALLPWLSKKDEVNRLGSDRQPDMARMCDHAVWIAHLLGVSFSPQPEYLDHYPPEVIASVKDALAALPD